MEEKRGILDLAVERLARAMNAVGLNGTRLLWKWNQKRQQLAETGLRTEILWRSAKTRHKMCRSCRALVPRSARKCPECGAALAQVSTPGLGRLVTNVIPGVTAATSLLLLVNGFWFVIMLLAQIKAGSAGGGGLFGGFDLEMMARFGAGVSRPRMLSTGVVTGGEWWRLITPIFLHGGLLHFFFNSYVLIQLGPIAEEIYGTPRYWVIYLCCGIAGSMASQFPRYVITVGASGAIMGLMGLLLVFGWRRGGALGQSLKAAMIRFGIYIMIFSLFFPNIDHLNHAGGFVAGALLAMIVRPAEASRGRESTLWQALSLAGVLLVLYAFYQVAAVGRIIPGA